MKTLRQFIRSADGRRCRQFLFASSFPTLVFFALLLCFGCRWSAESYYESAYAKYKKADYEGAIIDCTHAIERDPRFADAYVERGNTHLAKGDSVSAMADYTEAIRVKPDSASAYCGQGRVRHLNGDYDGAIGDLTAALRFRPDYPVGDEQHDFQLLRWSLPLHVQPNNAYIYVARGNARWCKHDYTGALVDYDRATHLKSNYATAFKCRAMAREKTGDRAGSIVDSNEAVRLDPRIYQ